jgi:RimJ/RimL family protein N-acetyltransferase
MATTGIQLVVISLDRCAACLSMGFVGPRLLTDRLILRPWRVEDAAAALGIYGHPQVARWLSPEMDQVPDVAAMRLLLQHWIAEDARTAAPAGCWAIERRQGGQLLGGAILLWLPPGREDLELGWQLHPKVWGVGYASETTRALANWAFSHDVDEIFAVVRPGNTRAAATVRRNGMEWVGETDKYFRLDLQVFRLRRADFDPTAPPTLLPPDSTAE